MPSFLQKDKEYPFLGTTQDTVENLKMSDNLYVLMRAAAEVAGQIALRLTHDHELFLDFERYGEELLAFQEKFLPYDRDVKVRKAPSALNPCRLLLSHILIRLCCHWITTGWTPSSFGHGSVATCDLNQCSYRAAQAE